MGHTLRSQQHIQNLLPGELLLGRFLKSNLTYKADQLNTVNLCKNLIRSVESPGFPALTEFPVSQLVTYKFYVGKLDVFNGSYKKVLVMIITKCFNIN